MSHEISKIDLALGAIERHESEGVSWHGLETVRPGLSVGNCGLRAIDVQPMTLNARGQETDFRLPYVPHPINAGELLFLADKPFSKETYELFTPIEFVIFAGECFREAGLDDRIAFTTTLFGGMCQTIAKHIPDADFKDASKHEVKTYVNLLNSLNGKWPLFVNVSETRTVCNNTATANLHEGGASCKHRPEALRAFVKRFPVIFADAIATHKGNANDYLKMAGIEMTKEQATWFFAALLKGGKLDEMPKEDVRLSRKAYNLATDDLMTLFVKGKGNFGVSAADAYNAVTDYCTHNYSAEANAPGGTADDYKRDAKAALLSPTLPAILEKGKKLVTDVV
jgi:hypothetical protein